MSDSESEIGFAQLGLGSVLKQNQLAVPANQREYSWETKEVTTLFRDFSREIGEGDRKYFLGTVVTIPRPGAVLEVVDGQQRLATTAILLSAIRGYLQKMEPEIAESINSEFLSKYDRGIRSWVPRLRLNVDDNDYFRARIIGETPAPEMTKPSHRLIDNAFTQARRHVDKIVAEYDLKDHGNVLNRWIDFIESRAVIILLRVPNATNAYRMFETLNDRGKRVSQSDLVKNYLFGQAAGRFNEVQQRWAYMRGTLDALGDEDGTIDFLRHALTIIRGFVREADVYDRVQAYARGEQPVVSFAGQLEALANSFVAIQSPDHEQWNKYADGARQALEVLNLFDIRVMRPLLLALAEKLPERECDRAFRFCVSLAVRLMIGNRTRTGTVEEGLAEAGRRIYSGDVTTLAALKKQLETIAPTDGQFRSAFATATVSNRRLARYYLRSLEMQLHNEAQPWHIPNDDRMAINLEHVLPDKPEGNWPQFTDDDVKLYRNRIGNFALLRASENSYLRSAAFDVKRITLARSPYMLTRQVGEQEEWTTHTIDQRQQELADIALKAWAI
jgi:hypothetical protein